MEDAHVAEYNIAPNVHIFGVFDGHGGKNAKISPSPRPEPNNFLSSYFCKSTSLTVELNLGKEVAIFVAKNLVKTLLENESFKKKDYEKALTETFLKLDELLLSEPGKKELKAIRTEDGVSGSEESQAGCTANVALIADKILYVANAGDSRCVLSSKGQAVEMSIDHKPENPEERARIQAAGGFVSDNRVNGNLNLSRAIGDLEFKANSRLSATEQLIIAVPEIKKRELTADDEFIVLGCDGIWEVKTNQEIVEFIGKRLKDTPTVSKVVEDLLDNLVAPDTTSNFIFANNLAYSSKSSWTRL